MESSPSNIHPSDTNRFNSQTLGDAGDVSTLKAENNKTEKRSIDKGKQKESNTTTTTPEEIASVVAEDEEYELDDDEIDKTDDKDDTNKAGTIDTQKVSRRGRWSAKRKQILLDSYVTLRPFTARYGQVRGKWQALADIVNANEKATMGTLRARSCKDMVDKLLDTYKPLFSEVAAQNADTKLTSTKITFGNKLEEAAYRAFVMNASWIKQRQDEMIEDNVFPTSMQTHGLKRGYDDVSAEDDDENEEKEDGGLQSEKPPSEDAHTQTEPMQPQENATTPENPLNYLQYLKYLPVIAAALDTIAANSKK